MTRNEARTEAFKLVFQITAHKDSYPDVVLMFENDNAAMKKSDRKQYKYIVETANGVFEYMDKIDAVIEKNLKSDWSFERISKVSLAILRLAIYEIFYREDIPESVSANEAVELAKTYDIDDAPSFVNGVLKNVINQKGE